MTKHGENAWAEWVKTNDAAAALVGLSVRRFQEVKHDPGFPAKGPAGWRRNELVEWGATRASRLINLGPDGAAVQAEIFCVRATLLEIREQVIGGKLIPAGDAIRILSGLGSSLTFQVKNAFETYSTIAADAGELRKAEDAYRRFCSLMKAAYDDGKQVERAGDA